MKSARSNVQFAECYSDLFIGLYKSTRGCTSVCNHSIRSNSQEEQRQRYTEMIGSIKPRESDFHCCPSRTWSAHLTTPLPKLPLLCPTISIACQSLPAMCNSEVTRFYQTILSLSLLPTPFPVCLQLTMSYIYSQITCFAVLRAFVHTTCIITPSTRYVRNRFAYFCLTRFHFL